jgi:hypothetical protein
MRKGSPQGPQANTGPSRLIPLQRPGAICARFDETPSEAGKSRPVLRLRQLKDGHWNCTDSLSANHIQSGGTRMFTIEHLGTFLIGAAEAGKQCDGPHQEHHHEGHQEPLPRVEHSG